MNWVFLTQIDLPSAQYAHKLLINLSLDSMRDHSNWEWQVYRRRRVIRQRRARTGQRRRYRPIKPIWRWQCKVAAFREKACLIFPNSAFFTLSLCFLQPCFQCVVMLDIDLVIMLQNLQHQQPVKLGTYLSRGPMD